LEEIKKAYRALSLKHHPDKQQMLSADQQLLSTTKFLEISLSYKYLLANKSIYDNLLKQSDPAYFKDRLISLDT